MGSHLYKAAQTLQIPVEIVDSSLAFAASWLMRQISWRLLNRRPPNMEAFSQAIVAACKEYQPKWLLVTGILSLPVETLKHLKQMQIVLLNYLTDDPWNPSHSSSLFMQNLPLYDYVFTPRRSNLDDLRSIGCTVQYVQFAYEPTIHFRESPPSEQEERYKADVMFYGGADRDRLPMMKAIIEAGFKLRLYGGYWDRHPVTRQAHSGFALGAELRWAISSVSVCLCPVRRANRDGHVMRSFEIPAMGGCPLVEDTDEHREIYGEEGKCALYFRNDAEIIAKLRILLNDRGLRLSLSQNAYQQITGTMNTYSDRLLQMLESSEKLVSRTTANKNVSELLNPYG